ncbi:hypothetical protein B0H14DRAFT_3629282 [Mycena olivaceomarginata]|nr:hypothetical protein B0H14DRAFT_3629282 [Mycena olivaceomarginata]
MPPSRTPWFSSILPYSLAPPSHRFLRAQRARQSVPTACAAFIASSRAMCVSSKYHSPRPWTRRAYPLQRTHRTTPRGRSTCCSRSLSPHAAVSPPRPLPLCPRPSLSSTRSQLLSGPGSTIRQHHRSTHQAPILCADAGDRLETSTCSPLRAPSPDPPGDSGREALYTLPPGF